MSEQEYRQRMQQAKEEYQNYRRSGGENVELDWLWDYDRDLFGEMQSRWRFQSSYTVITGGVLFCPQPMRR
jgi:hypothetical protein